MPPLREFPFEFLTALGFKKKIEIWRPYQIVKKCDEDMYIRLDTIPASDRRTDLP